MSRIPKDYKPTVDEVNKYINKSFIMTYKDLYDRLPESELKSQLYKKYIQLSNIFLHFTSI